jgi:hypothetical protein
MVSRNLGGVAMTLDQGTIHYNFRVRKQSAEHVAALRAHAVWFGS